ncbi:16S rRNA (guanine(966)-N(2))-methyltransferase RsmD [Coxiella endosymbiont of Amblyomma nuttalli]|uniref:16S rRNA (guanine(966)-N(2))-methyltransferase RsmD n=1 Tax=Coxiella endosymbiont of Amblyomma nuttalli TaxID=2749996 RepID=UPI001BA6D3D9|nr:16S rRNA (guanine(966)-N(2))-methyltransferase RsmD [Coxiella endosymbiont of Amblyomma nuttalli]QTS83556.1 Ribosomal RNA small subunit methyltransferase D [Coxiella endosymbiont of Amblyomma nuttalli]
MSKRLQGKVRIIGGKWRGRGLVFPEVSNLRPTGNRVRETVFNWLMPYIVGANCLDLFAGSGAFGFEALSRGATHVTFIDHSDQIINALRKNAAILKAINVEFIRNACLFDFPLLKKNISFDIIFLDPPFRQGFIRKAGEWLEKIQIMSDHAFIYVEVEKDLKPLPVPENWTIYRRRATGALSYNLFLRRSL